MTTVHYVDHCADHMAESAIDLKDIHQLGWCRQCYQQVYVRVLASVLQHDIRLLPTDPAKDHRKRDEWRSECSCGWAGPPDAGQGPAADHWLNHMRQLEQP